MLLCNWYEQQHQHVHIVHSPPPETIVWLWPAGACPPSLSMQPDNALSLLDSLTQRQAVRLFWPLCAGCVMLGNVGQWAVVISGGWGSGWMHGDIPGNQWQTAIEEILKGQLVRAQDQTVNSDCYLGADLYGCCHKEMALTFSYASPRWHALGDLGLIIFSWSRMVQ